MEADAQPLNPWLSIWFHPRRTIRYIVETNPTEKVHLLAALAGMVNLLDRAMRGSWGDGMAWYLILILIAVFGSLAGIVGVYIGGEIFRWVGGKLGGVATSQQVRAAIAWSYLPGIVSVIPVFIYILAVRQEAFTSATPRLDALAAQSPGFSFLMIFVGVWLVVIGVVLGVWQFVLLSKTLGEVLGFSSWRGLATWLLPAAVVFVLLFALFVLPKVLYFGP